MISKSTIKLIHSLEIKKYRTKENLFVVEGDKNVLEVLKSSYVVSHIFATKNFLLDYKEVIRNANQISEVTDNELKKASLLKSPQSCIAICEITTPPLPDQIEENLSVYLDGVQDPGNVGTIIRICDWFGVKNLFCSADTADLYNPKVIQASMGSFCRVSFHCMDFDKILNLAQSSDVRVLGAFLEGNNIYEEELTYKTLLVVGNEGNGIRKEIEPHISQKIKIPSFAGNGAGAESLNVAIATGIICAEFRRQGINKDYSK